MKKLLTIISVFVMLLCIGTTAGAQTYKTGKVYVEGSPKAYGNGDTITVQRGTTIHVARIADGKAPLSSDDFWFSCWYPDTLTKKGFKLYGAGEEDGAEFKDYSGAYGPYIDTSNVKPGNYTLKFFFASAKDVEAHYFSGAKKYDPITIKIKVTKESQKLSVKAKAQKVSYEAVKKGKVTISSAVEVTGAKTTVTYKKKSGSKYFNINNKTGKITVKKKTPKGKYSINLVVTANGSKIYKEATKTVKVTITVE